MTDTHTEGVFKDREEEFRALQKAHAGLKGSYRKAQQTLTLKDHIIKTREFERDEARRECAELAFSDEEELTGEIIARNLRELADRLHSDTRNEPSFHSSPSAEARAKVVELAKQFCDHEPLSPRKQAGHRVGLHRAVAKLREIERHV